MISVNRENQDDDSPEEFTIHLATGSERRLTAATDSVKLTAHVIPEGNEFVAIMDGLELNDSDGNPFIAMVDGMELKGRGSTAPQAQDDLVRAMRSWLERQDTAGKLGESLGVEGLSENTEVTLQFVDPAEADRRRSDLKASRPLPADRTYNVEWEAGVSVYTVRG